MRFGRREDPQVLAHEWILVPAEDRRELRSDGRCAVSVDLMGDGFPGGDDVAD